MKAKRFKTPQGAERLSHLMKSRQETAKYKTLCTEEFINKCIEERRAKLERLEAGFYAGLLEWLTFNLFQASTFEDFGKKKVEFREFRQAQYKKLLSKKETERKLEINVRGKNRTIEVY